MSPRLAAAAAAIGLAVAAMLAPSPAHAAVQAEVISTATYPLAVDIDSAGNIWIGYANGPMTPKGVTVIPAANGTIFGVPVTAGVETRIFDINNVQGLVMSPAGHLFVVSDGTGLFVATATNTTVFGVATTANVLTPIPSTSLFKGGIDFDSAGNLFGGQKASGGVVVLPVSTGTLYGESVTANTASLLKATPDWTGDVAVDGQDNLFIGSWFSAAEGVYVLPKVSGTLYGQTVVQDTMQQLVAAARVSGLDLDDSNNLYFAQWSVGQIQVLSPVNRVLFGESIPANTATVLAGSSGQADQGIAVAAAGGVIASGGPQTVRLVASVPPTVTTVSPSSGSLDGGTSVTITGTALSGATSVTFGGVAGTSVVVVDDSTLTVTTPASVAGTVDVVVTTGSGSATAVGGFTFVAPPPPPPVPAGPPVGVTVQAGAMFADVSWSAPESAGSYPVTNYQVRGTRGGHSCLVPADVTSCRIAGLRPGVPVSVQVRALTGAGWSPWSEAVVVVPQPAQPSIMITGSREGSSVVVRGVTTGMVGQQVTPWVRFPGPHAYEPVGSGSTVSAGGTFTWQWVTAKKTYVYFRASDGVRSNRVIIPAAGDLLK